MNLEKDGAWGGESIEVTENANDHETFATRVDARNLKQLET